MSDSSNAEGADRAGQNRSGGGNRPSGGRPSSGSQGGGNRNRNRNRNRGGRGGGGGGSATGTRSGGGNGRNGSQPRAKGGSPGRSPGGSGGQGGRSSRDGSRSGSGPPLVVTPVAPAVERGGDGGEEAAAVASNRRKAIQICTVPGVVAGVVVGIVVVALGLPIVIGVAALVVVAVGTVLWLWRSAPKVVLRAVGARPSHEWEHPRLYNLVDGLCATMGLPAPAILVVDSPVPNAMSIGHDPGSASLVVTSGLDATLTLVELEGVLAHELVHIKRHDTVLAGVAVVTTAPWAALTGIAGGMERVHRLTGRGKEFDADQRAARVVRYPPGIGSALDTMVARSDPAAHTAWPPNGGRLTALTRWLWIDPMAGAPAGESAEGNLDDTRVRAAALALW